MKIIILKLGTSSTMKEHKVSPSTVHIAPDRHIVSSSGQRSQYLSGVTSISATVFMRLTYHFLGDPTSEDGYIEPSKSHDEIRQEPYSLPKEFEWSIIDIDDPKQVTRPVITPNLFS
jgi:hypothetical protein